MLASIDIKLIGVVGLLFIISIGYFVYSIYKDLVFLKNEVSEINNLIIDDSWNSTAAEQKTDEEQDLELEEHLRSFMEQQEEEKQEPVIVELEEEEEQKPKKRKYNKKKNLEEMEEI